MRTGVNRDNITFDSNGLACASWFYRTSLQGERPCVVMAHGLAAIKEMRLDAYTREFVQAGYHVLAFDYR